MIPVPSNYLTSIEIDNNGVMWIGSSDAGLIRFYNGTWINYTRENSPLPGNMINDLVIDRFGNVWIATNSGLASFNGSSWNIYDTRTSPLPSQ